MELDDGLPVTEAQWMEHTEGWRLAHLDRAPSALLRQLASPGRDPAAGLPQSERHRWASPPHLAVEMLVILAVVTAVVIGAALR